MATKYLDKTGLAYFWNKLKAWCHGVFVHRTGDEAVTGVKSFSNSYAYNSSHADWKVSGLHVVSQDITKGTFPAKPTFASLLFLDTNVVDLDYVNRLGAMEYVAGRNIAENGNGRVDIKAYKTVPSPNDASNLSTALSVGFDVNNVAFATAPSTSSDRNNGTDIVTRDWLASDTGLVHTTGDEAIQGLKVFQQPSIVLQENNVELANVLNAPSGSNNEIFFADKNYDPSSGVAPEPGITRLGEIQWQRRTNGGGDSVEITLRDTNGIPHNIGVLAKYDSNSDYAFSYGYAPSTPLPEVNNSNAAIITRDFIPKDVRIVHTTGNEEISGTKTFKNSAIISLSVPKLDLQMTNLDTTVVSSTNKIHSAVSFCDKNGLDQKYRTATIQSGMTSSDDNFVRMIAYDPTADAITYAGVSVHYPRGGDPYVTGVTPASLSDDSAKIPTTEWVRDAVGDFACNAATASDLADGSVLSMAKGGTGASTRPDAQANILAANAHVSGSFDFDDFTSSGVNTFGSGTTLTNCPNGSNGLLFTLASTGIKKQFFSRFGSLDVNDHYLGFRTGTGTSWSGWHKIFTDADVVPVANGGTGSSTKNFVDLSSDQTVAGAKAFSSSVGVLHGVERGTNPSSNTYKQFNFLDSTGTNSTQRRAACVESMLSPEGSSYVYLRAYQWASGSALNATLTLGYPAGGSPFLTGPSPASLSDDSTKLATTEWVRDATGDFACNAATVSGTAGTSALAWNSEVTLATVGGHAVKAKLPANPNTDTKVRQYVGTTNVERPVLSRYNANDATQTANYAVYDTGVTVNPSRHTLTASGGFIGSLDGTAAEASRLSLTYCGDCNAALASGSYYTDSSTANAPAADAGFLTVEGPVGGRLVQTFQTTQIAANYYSLTYKRFVTLTSSGAYSASTLWHSVGYVSRIADDRSIFMPSGSVAVLCPPAGTQLPAQSGSIYEMTRFYHWRDASRDSSLGSYGYIARYSGTTSPTSGGSNQSQFLIGDFCGGIPSAAFSFGAYYRCSSNVTYDDSTTETVYGELVSVGDVRGGKTVAAVEYDRKPASAPWLRYEVDNYATLGQSTYRFATVYAGTGTINTSDERLKNSIGLIPDDVLDAWGAVVWVQYQFNDALEEKGGGARLHTGAVAQRISEAFAARGLDASRYGLFCYDRWDEEWDESEDGVRIKTRDAGDRYSLRYEEALSMEAAYLRRENARLKERVSDLEDRLAALELRLGSA